MKDPRSHNPRQHQDVGPAPRSPASLPKYQYRSRCTYNSLLACFHIVTISHPRHTLNSTSILDVVHICPLPNILATISCATSVTHAYSTVWHRCVARRAWVQDQQWQAILFTIGPQLRCNIAMAGHTTCIRIRYCIYATLAARWLNQQLQALYAYLRVASCHSWPPLRSLL